MFDAIDSKKKAEILTRRKASAREMKDFGEAH